MIIKIKQMNGQTLEVEMDDTANVAELKLRLKEMLSVDIDRQRLIVNGRVLQNDLDLLQELSHGNQSLVLHLVIRPENFPSSTASTGPANNSNNNTNNNSSQPPRPPLSLPPQFQQFGNVIVGSLTLQDGDAESFLANGLSGILGQLSGGRPINISSMNTSVPINLQSFNTSAQSDSLLQQPESAQSDTNTAQNSPASTNDAYSTGSEPAQRTINTLLDRNTHVNASFESHLERSYAETLALSLQLQNAGPRHTSAFYGARDPASSIGHVMSELAIVMNGLSQPINAVSRTITEGGTSK
jgi:hypothetical protein